MRTRCESCERCDGHFTHYITMADNNKETMTNEHNPELATLLEALRALTTARTTLLPIVSPYHLSESPDDPPTWHSSMLEAIGIIEGSMNLLNKQIKKLQKKLNDQEKKDGN